MSIRKLYGQTMLFDTESRTILHGEIALLSNDDGRSEIQVRNPETGETATIAQDSPLVEEIMQALYQVHEAVAL